MFEHEDRVFDVYGVAHVHAHTWAVDLFVYTHAGAHSSLTANKIITLLAIVACWVFYS